MKSDNMYMELALKQAEKSIEQGGFPAGAVVVKDGKVLSEGISVAFKLHDPTSHAETEGVRTACKALETTHIEGATLYASLQPCTMCFSVANWAKVSRIVYAAKKNSDMISKEYYKGHTVLEELNQQNVRKIELVQLSEYEKQSLSLIVKWEESL